MPVGYSIAFAEHVKALRKAHPDNPLYELGMLCIAHDISIVELADRLGVSKQAVYDWFDGNYEPKPETVERIHTQIKKLKTKK
jgi:DNA-binding XRE family transcriptional regulator